MAKNMTEAVNNMLAEGIVLKMQADEMVEATRSPLLSIETKHELVKESVKLRNAAELLFSSARLLRY